MTIAIANKPILAFTATDLIPAPTQGYFAIIWPAGSTDTVLSINSHGEYETRPITKPDGSSGIGTNETFRIDGDKLIGVIPEGIFVIPFVEWND